MLSTDQIIDALVRNLNEKKAAEEGPLRLLYAQFLQSLADPFAEKTEDLLSELKRGLSRIENTSDSASAPIVGAFNTLIELCAMMRNQKVPVSAVRILAKSSVARAIADAVQASGSLTPAEVAKRLQKNSQNLVELERQMVNTGLLRRDEFGRSVRYSATPLLRTCSKILTGESREQAAAATESVALAKDILPIASNPMPGPTGRILIIEDEPKVARTLVKGLEADGCAVDLAGDGEEGLQMATEIDYDAVVLDWNLPKLDGLTVLKKLRKSGSNVRILFLSARKDVSDRVAALQSGADDYLVKPFSFEEVQARLHALLLRPQELLDKLQVEDLELDRMRHMVTRGGKPINLTKREYAVLEYLMRNAGSTVTRTMVVDYVWNLGFEGMTNLVDVYINYLRAKVDQGFAKPLIHTAKGVGFILSAGTEAS